MTESRPETSIGATNPSAELHDPRTALEAINVALAALLHEKPAALAQGADRSLEDSLVICGILGGKDVGKSTLINALAQCRVSRDEEEVGHGTVRPMAYIHREAVDAYRRRFSGTNGEAGHFDVTQHNADAIRNLVLVDLPDFDSDLPGHRETVGAVAPLLDRIIWVVTPRKIGDRVWVSFFKDVLKDRRNVYCALNKTDELLNDDVFQNGMPDSFWQEQQSWLEQIIRRSDCPHDEDHRYLITAAMTTAEAFTTHVAEAWDDPQWQRYHRDRGAVQEIGRRLAAELDRLRACVLTPVSGEQADQIKRVNQRFERRSNVATLKTHYRLDEWADRLAKACDPEYFQATLNQAFDEESRRLLVMRLAATQRSETALADELLAERVEAWPLLRVVYWPLRGLVRRLGARLSGGQETGRRSAGDPLDVRGRSIEERLAAFRERLMVDHARVIRRFQLDDRFPSPPELAQAIRTTATSMIQDLDHALVDRLVGAKRPPAWWQRAGLWLVLVWFMLGQPLLEGLLQATGAADGTWNLLAGAYQLVRAMSPAHLLQGLAVVLATYLLILALLYAGCVRAVREMRCMSNGDGGASMALNDELDAVLIEKAVAPLFSPFVDIRGQLEDAQKRLGRIAGG